MKVLLEGLLPRLFPNLSFLCVPHEGKQDLEKSIPKKLRAWREPGVCFIVIQDNDGGDCHSLKTSLNALCHGGGRGDSLVRIACQELEAWYFGEPDAMAEAFADDRLRRIGSKALYREPDASSVRPPRSRGLCPSSRKSQARDGWHHNCPEKGTSRRASKL